LNSSFQRNGVELFKKNIGRDGKKRKNRNLTFASFYIQPLLVLTKIPTQQEGRRRTVPIDFVQTIINLSTTYNNRLGGNFVVHKF